MLLATVLFSPLFCCCYGNVWYTNNIRCQSDTTELFSSNLSCWVYGTNFSFPSSIWTSVRLSVLNCAQSVCPFFQRESLNQRDADKHFACLSWTLKSSNIQFKISFVLQIISRLSIHVCFVCEKTEREGRRRRRRSLKKSARKSNF